MSEGAMAPHSCQYLALSAFFIVAILVQSSILRLMTMPRRSWEVRAVQRAKRKVRARYRP